MDKPKVVCLCGSTRFMDAVYEAYAAECEKGNTVLTYLGNREAWHSTLLKVKFDAMHKRKIDLADEILVLNVGGYVGESTQREIDYARATGKKVRWLEHNIPAWKKTLNKARRLLER